MLVDINKKYPNLKKKILKPLLINCNPNLITLLSLISAIVSGYFFYNGMLILASFFLAANGFLDILDGEIARKFKRQSKLGDMLDHTTDRISDVIIFLGVALNPSVPNILGFLTIVFMLMVSYMGTQFQAITNRRLYGGIVGRSDRIFLLFLFGIGSMFFEKSLYYGVIFILILSIVTFLQRLYKSIKEIKSD